MTSEKIRVLIVDDFSDTRESISKLLYFERDIEVVGYAQDGQQAIQAAKSLRPDVILMDINMPVMDGIAATEVISSAVPESAVIMMSVQGEADYLRRAMLAGAREYLVKPFTGDELAGSIRHVYELGTEKRARFAVVSQPATPAAPSAAQAPARNAKVISVFSPKGGVGCTTVAANLAVALRMSSGKKVALADCSLLFGDIGIMLNLPAKKSISDLVPNAGSLDQELLESILVEHDSGVRVLLAPPRPELAELVTADHLRSVMNLLRASYDYVIVDTHASFDDATLTVLDISDHILVLTTLEMPAIKNMKLFLEVAEALHYPQGKLMLVLNRADSTGGIRVEDIEQNIRFKVSANIVSAGQVVTAAVNQGIPVVTSSRDSTVSKNILDLAKLVMMEEDLEGEKETVSEAVVSREPQSRRGLTKFRLPAFASLGSKKGSI